ncbi:hypothetical protein ONK29_26055, partial [Salmonella enterica subsp. enterica serovar Anatum]|nr:hypothetical protein [Salmonella enterica subsp. enterica serovar Anatum]
DFPAKDARTIVEFKKRYKHLLVQGHYFKGLLAGSAYLYRKLFLLYLVLTGLMSKKIKFN